MKLIKLFLPLALLSLVGCADDGATESSTMPHAQPAPWEGSPAFVDSPGRYGY